MSAESACLDLARRLAAAVDEDLARFAREEAPHLDACPPCRARLAQRDPAALFALLAFEKKGDAFFAGFETRVMAGVREAAREPRGGWLGAILRPRYLGLAAGCAALAIAVAMLLESPGPAPVPGGLGGRAAAGSATGTAPSFTASVLPGLESAPSSLAPIERDAAAPSPVESVASATARVISIQVAGPQHEASDLVLIVDPEMPL